MCIRDRGGAVKAAKAVTLTDEQMTEYVKEYIDWMDKHLSLIHISQRLEGYEL